MTIEQAAQKHLPALQRVARQIEARMEVNANEFSRHSGHTMSKHPLLLGLTLLSASLFTGGLRRPHRHRPAGSPVTLPDHVTRVVVLQHQTLNLLVQLHAAEDIVGVLSSWKKQLGRSSPALCPRSGNWRPRAISPGQY